MKKFKIKKGDKVTVIAGRDKGRGGEVLKVLTNKDRVVVSDVNVAKRHKKPSQAGAGGIVEKSLPIHISNVALIDPKSDKATRVGYKTLDNGEKVRFAKKSGEVLS